MRYVREEIFIKARMALESLRGDQRYGVASDQVSRWRKRLIEQAPKLFADGRKERIAQLEQLNGYAERFIRTLKEEEVYLHEYEDIHDARVHIERFIEDVYMRRRVHSALGYLTPAGGALYFFTFSAQKKPKTIRKPLFVPGNEFVYEFPLYSITTLKLAVR